MKNNMFVISAFLFMALICLPQASHGQWIKQVIDPNLEGVSIIYVTDFDGDKDTDVLATGYLQPIVAWYEHKGDNPVQWQQHMIDNTLPTPHEVGGCDIDGDGDLDVVVAESVDHAIVWFENLGGPPFTWTKHTIDGQLSWAAWLTVEDIDGDGDPDIAASSYYKDLCYWYENLGGTPLKWHKYSFGANGGGFLRFVDMDGDSALDMVTCANENVFWYKNNLPDTNWTINIIDNTLSQTRQIRVADMDNDKDTDIVITTNTENDVYWYKNMGGMPIQWKRYLIDDKLNTSAGLDLADINSDSLPDVVAAGNAEGKIAWYKNNLPDTVWTKNTIDTDLPGATYVLTHDFDFDGDPDVFAGGQSDNQLVWYRNMVNQAYAQSLSCQPESIPLSGDTLSLRAKIYIPANHQAVVYAVINDTQNGFKDSLQLYDDYNGRVNDGIWGNQIDFKPQNETIYSLGISIWDNTTNNYFYSPDLSSFESVTGIEKGIPNFPKKFALFQNYPNPFNLSTTIKFSLPKSEFVELKVYNIVGKEVATLVSKKLNPGNYTYTFNGQNLASGIYYYQLVAVEYREVKKMILLK